MRLNLDTDGRLDILCQWYEKLTETDKEVMIRLAEGLFKSQKIIDKEFKLIIILVSSNKNLIFIRIEIAFFE